MSRSYCLLVTILLLPAIGACASRLTGNSAAVPVVRTESHCDIQEIQFSAIMADGQRLPRVDISTMSRKGLEKIAATNEFGEACVSKSLAFAPGVTAVLFCTRNFYCTALLNEPGMSDFREMPIVLSQMVVF